MNNGLGLHQQNYATDKHFPKSTHQKKIAAAVPSVLVIALLAINGLFLFQVNNTAFPAGLYFDWSVWPAWVEPV